MVPLTASAARITLVAMTDDAQQPPAVVAPHKKVGMLPPYAAGKPPVAVPGLHPYKLSSNENPYAPVSGVIDRVRQVVTGPEGAPSTLCRYPDTLSTGLRQALAAHLDVPADDVVTGAGSLGALAQVITAFAGHGEAGEGDEVIFAWRSFEAYPIVVRTAGAVDVQVPLTADHRHDLPAMLEAITERTRVILLCTPNNPTGPVLTTAEVEDFLARVPAHILVVIDEAYVEFVRDEDAVKGLEMYRKHANVVVLRTFSKAHGLANLRVGYSVSQPEITKALRTVATPFAVSTVAEEAAIASLEHLDEVLERVQIVVDERERQRLARFDPPDPQQVKGFSRGGPVRPGPPEVRDLTRKHAVVQEHPDVAASRRAQQVRRLPVGREHGRASRRSLPQARAEGRHPVENRPQRLAEQAAAEIAAESGRCRLASAHRPPHEGSIDPPQRRRSIHRAPADMMRHVERPGGVLPMGLPEGGPLP